VCIVTYDPEQQEIYIETESCVPDPRARWQVISIASGQKIAKGPTRKMHNSAVSIAMVRAASKRDESIDLGKALGLT